MIKRILYKLKYLLIIIIALLGLISFSHWNFERPVWVYGYSPEAQGYNLNITTRWNFLTESLGYTKKMLMPRNSFFIFWWYNWIPYIFDSGLNRQWFITRYYVCSVLPDNSGFPQNCVSNSVWSWTSEIFWTFIKHLSTSDIYYVGAWSYNWAYAYWFVCISSSELWSSLCFYSSDVDDNWISYWFTADWGFDWVNSVYLYDPPKYSWNWNWEMDGDQSADMNNSMTWDYVYSDCTYKQLFDYLESFWYNDYVCYWWLDNFDLYDPEINYSPIPWSWKTLGQILTYHTTYETRDSSNDWFIFRNWLYQDRFTGPDNGYSSMWSSYPAVYRTWFDLYYRYWGESLVFDAVREYCLLKQWDFNFETTLYKWKYFEKACNNVKAWVPWWYDPVPWSWSSDNAVWVNWFWIWNIWSWWTYKTTSDPKVFIQDWFNALKQALPTKYEAGFWFLPNYILLFLIALIFFRFLSH